MFVIDELNGNADTTVSEFGTKNFYKDLKKSVVIDSPGLDGNRFANIYFGGPILSTEFDALLPRVKNYLQKLDNSYTGNGNINENDIHNMLDFCKINISAGNDGATAVKNYGI